MRAIWVTMLTLTLTAPPAAIAGQASVAVTTATPRLQNFDTVVGGYGSVAADPRTALRLTLPQPGEVAAVEVVPGQAVRAGAPLLKLISDPNARLAYAQATHAVSEARTALAQTRALYARQLATRAQLAAAQKMLADAESNLAAQRALGGASRQRVLTAPRDGVVQAVTVAVGERVAAGAPLLQLAPSAGLRARIGVEPTQAAQVAVGDPVRLVAVYGGGHEQARVVQVGEAIDAVTHLVDVWVNLPAGAHLPLGTALQAQIVTARRQAWAVPRGAVLSDARGSYLFQVDRGVARRVAVRLVHPAGNTVGVVGALDPRRPVVVLGAYELADGMRVRIAKP